MRFLVFLVAICSVVSAPAKVVLSSLFTDNMVLQQQTDVQIWGASSKKMIVNNAFLAMDEIESSLHSKLIESLL